MKFHYNEHSLKPGIYKILNTHTNRIYIGQAKEFKERWKAHASSLRLGKHKNSFLRADFNKCKEALGHDDFLEFHVLEVLEGSTKEERNKREEWWIAQTLINWQCYNFELKPSKSEQSIWSRSPEQTRQRRSQAHKGKHYSTGTEFSKGEDHPGFGKPLSEEIKQKLSLANKGKHNPTEATRELIRQANLGSNNPNFGKRKSDITKARMSQAHSARKKVVIQQTLHGEVVHVHASIMEASRATNINHSSIIACCRGRLRSAGGFRWMYS